MITRRDFLRGAAAVAAAVVFTTVPRPLAPEAPREIVRTRGTIALIQDGRANFVHTWSAGQVDSIRRLEIYDAKTRRLAGYKEFWPINVVAGDSITFTWTWT